MRDQCIQAPCGDVWIGLVTGKGRQVLIGISAPPDCSIRRSEVPDDRPPVPPPNPLLTP
jgi:hypothetical protein